MGDKLLKAGGASVCLLGLLIFTTMATAGALEKYTSTGAAAPLRLRDLANEFHALEQYQGKVVLVNFWGSWCLPCVEEMPVLQRLEKKYERTDFVILAVNVNQTRTSVQRFVNAMALNLTVLLDSSAITAKAWSVEYYPSSFLIDKSGDIRLYNIGMLDWEKDEVLKTIDSLIEE